MVILLGLSLAASWCPTWLDYLVDRENVVELNKTPSISSLKTVWFVASLAWAGPLSFYCVTLFLLSEQDLLLLFLSPRFAVLETRICALISKWIIRNRDPFPSEWTALSCLMRLNYEISYFSSPQFFCKFIFNWRIIALQCCVSAIQHRESPINIHIPLPFEPPSHPPLPL